MLPDASTIKAGAAAATCARYRLSGPAAVHEFLLWLAHSVKNQHAGSGRLPAGAAKLSSDAREGLPAYHVGAGASARERGVSGLEYSAAVRPSCRSRRTSASAMRLTANSSSRRLSADRGKEESSR